MFTQNRANGFSAKASFILQDTKVDIKPFEYNIIEYTTPTYSLNPVRINHRGTTGTIPGDTIEKEQSTILKFIVDENLEVYFRLLELMENAKNNGTIKDTLNINIMNNFHKIIANAIYSKAWVGGISPLRYTTTENETTIYVDVTLNYLDFDLKAV